jgi:hypothetical protein
MTGLRWLRNIWRTLTRSAELDTDLHREIETFVDLAADEAVARGEDPAEARRQALAHVGGVTSVEEAVRARRRGSWVSHAMRDAR